MEKTIEIPEGYEARIEGNKVILEQKSEDNRIRREIIDYFHGCIHRNKKTGFRVEQIKGWIAYLERQKEQQPAEWSDNFEENIRKLLHDKLTWHSKDRSVSSSVFIDDKTLKDIISGIWFYVGKEALKYPNKELSQPEWSEDWREEDIQTRFAFYTYKDDPSVLYLSNVFVEETSRNHGFGTRILKAAEKAAEAIGAITICLKVKQDSPANAWYRKRGYGYVTFEDGYDWLEKNLEYLKPAKSAGWSEELDKVAEEYCNRQPWPNDGLDEMDKKECKDDFKAGAEWQREQMEDEHGKELLYVCQKTAEREHRSGVREGKAQAEKDLIPLINRLCEAILFEWKDAADLARKTLTQIKAQEE